MVYYRRSAKKRTVEKAIFSQTSAKKRTVENLKIGLTVLKSAPSTVLKSALEFNFWGDGF